MYRNVLRLTSFLILLFNINLISVLVEGLFNVKGKRYKALYGYSFLNITETSMERCMAKCLENCRCLSFQMCDHEECQLCSSDKDQSPSAFRERRGCTYYGFQRDLSGINSQQCHQGCSIETSCCISSKPCLNGGTCQPASPTDTTTRFKCRCPAGYTGDLCQEPIKSCQSYINSNHSSGIYKVVDADKQLFEVYCDFDLDLMIAWTLIQSYQRQKAKHFRVPFFSDHPVDPLRPSWNSYRLSKPRMMSIQQNSTRWRMTCQYDSDGVNYTDYVEAANEKIDILTYNSVECMEVEYIDVRGITCYNSTAFLWQGNTSRSATDPSYPLHFHNNGSSVCSSQPDHVNCSDGESYFGDYKCFNTQHRCSATDTATTQTWFGSY